MGDHDQIQNYRFGIGQIVRHKRYAYRGVIYDSDASCQADEQWYQDNQTQPDRNQPWYHVLVHDHSHTTYVAQSNLECDPVGGRIRHPLLDRFFHTYLDGRYYTSFSN